MDLVDVYISPARARAECHAALTVTALVVALGPGQHAMAAQLLAEVLAGAAGAYGGITDPGGGIDPSAGSIVSPGLGHLPDRLKQHVQADAILAASVPGGLEGLHAAEAGGLVEQEQHLSSCPAIRHV